MSLESSENSSTSDGSISSGLRERDKEGNPLYPRLLEDLSPAVSVLAANLRPLPRQDAAVELLLRQIHSRVDPAGFDRPIQKVTGSQAGRDDSLRDALLKNPIDPL